MSDTIDMYNDMRAHRRAVRDKYGVPCPNCNIKQPKREPTMLIPGQRCKVDGYKDPRSPLTNAEMQAMYDQIDTP